MLYEEVGGFDAILALCRRWHQLCLAYPVAAHPFEHGLHAQHEERLAAYLSEVWGGPCLFSAMGGDESHVQRVHAGNGEHIELDEFCIGLFDQAVDEQQWNPSASDRAKSYFRSATEAMRIYGEKDAIVPHELPFRYESAKS